MPQHAHFLSHHGVYRACVKEAALRAPTLVQRAVGRALEAMQAAAAASSDVVERNLLAEAAKRLAHHEQALCESFRHALMTEVTHALAGAARRGALRFDSLDLLPEDQVQENVELVRTQQAVRQAVQPELAPLDALMCAAQQLAAVTPEGNPLRPETYVRALHEATRASPVPASARRRWLTHLGLALGAELGAEYREMAALLAAQGVRPLAPGQGAPATPPPRLDLEGLRKLLAGELDHAGGAAPVSAPGFDATVPAALETLRELGGVEHVLRRLEARPQAPAAEEAAPRSAAQLLGQEVIHLMIEQLSGDARLLPPVRAALQALEPALLRLGLGDPRFFSNRRHPARQLLEEVTQRSLAWRDTAAPGFARFLGGLREAVQALLHAPPVEGAEAFALALRALREDWAEQQQQERRAREKAVRALQRAEERHLLARQLAAELRARADLAGAPPEVVQFLAGPWAHVMAQARLAGGGAEDPQGWGSAVPELLWSTRPGAAAAEPARLARTVPRLLDRLRRGLRQIGYPEPEVQRLLDGFAPLHRQALAPTRARPLSREELHAQLDEAAQAAPWLAPAEAEDSGFMTSHGSVPADLETGPAPQAQAWSNSALDELGLQPGAWVEMFDAGWERWQLTWASPHGSLFLFTRGDGQAQSMPRRLLEGMLAAGSVRLVSPAAMLDGALDAVAQAALRRSALGTG